MDKKAMMKMAGDLEKAIVLVLKMHNIPMSEIEVMGSEAGDFYIKVKSPAATAKATGLTPNAVARYQQHGAKLGLPKIGSAIKIGGVEHKLLGLSSDGKRVKVRKLDAKEVSDMKLGDVLHAVSMSAAAQVAKLEADEQAEPIEQVAPEILAMLGNIAAKPAQGGPSA